MNNEISIASSPQQTIYLFTTLLHNLLIKLVLYLNDYNVVLITNLNNIKKHDIVIPCTVKAQAIYYKNNIYTLLDNKTSFYKYLYDNYKDKMNHIRFIPSYDKYYKGKNKHSKFLIKPNDDYGSKNQIIESGFIYEIISKYAKNHQIQDIIDINVIYEMDFVCKKGNIIDSIFHKTYAKTRKYIDYYMGINSIQTINIPKGLVKLCKKIIEDAKYNGFIQFEFIEDTKGTIYIMEWNPRLSSHLTNPQYFKKLIEPIYNIKSRYCNYLIKQSSYNCDTEIYNCDTEVKICNHLHDIYTYLAYQTKKMSITK